MKKVIYSLFLALFLISCNFYTKTPVISIETSQGVTIKNNLYFMINYKLFVRPIGIATIPDGGKSKILNNEYFIMEYQKNEKLLKTVSSIIVKKKDLMISSLKLSKEGNIINFLVSYSVQDPSRSIWGENLYKLNIENRNIKIIPNYKGDFNPMKKSELIKRREINKLFNYVFDYPKIGLKDPLDYIKKDDKTLKNIILKKQGNEKFRIAVLGYIISKKKFKLLDEIKEENSDEQTKQLIEKVFQVMNRDYAPSKVSKIGHSSVGL